MTDIKEQYALFYSQKQADIAGEITVTTPDGNKYTYTEMTTVEDGQVRKPTSNFADFNQVAVIDKDTQNNYSSPRIENLKARTALPSIHN